MTTLLYDDTFEGFLTCVFEAYDRRLTEVEIVPEKCRQVSLFGRQVSIEADEAKTYRVLAGLQKHLDRRGLYTLLLCFFSELPGNETRLLHYIRHVMKFGSEAATDFSHPAVLYVSDVAKRVSREKHRMEAFVRFKCGADGLFAATIEPDYNVLPLIVPHFRKRYADQPWLIYDVKRKFGMHYDLHTVEQVGIELTRHNAASLPGVGLHADEADFQQLWKDYFHHASIEARRNTKLHLRHVPRRYWKYLIEKQA